MSDGVPYTFPVDVAQLPANGRIYTLTADEETRAAVAAHLDLQKVGRLVATLTVAPASGGVELTGRFDADVTQTCVVSLVPLPTTLSGEISRRFVAAPRSRPEPRPGKKAEKDAPEEGWIDPDEDVPDPIVDGQIDLGAVLIEELALALDPYPRAPGASFKALGEAESDGVSGQESPFAALKGLKPAAKGPTPRRGGAKSRAKARR